MAVGLSKIELGIIAAVLEKFPEVKQAVLFGSRAMNAAKPASDVDISLKGDLTLTLTAKVKAELEEGTPLPYTFDVVHYETIENRAFREHIDKQGVLIYERSVNL